jgi:fructose-1,6-bisphosphatase I/sedoheptulose-1,7-bisphosphatase
MLADRTTLNQFLIEERRRHPTATGDLNALINDVALACKAIAKRIAYGAIDNILGATAVTSIQGERQQKLDLLANELFLNANEWGGHLGGMVSEEMEELYAIPSTYPRGRYLMAFDPPRRLIEYRRQRRGGQYFFDFARSGPGGRRWRE